MTGDSIFFATPIQVNSTPRTFSDAIGFFNFSTGLFDINDYWSFSLSQTSNFSLDLTGLSDDADVQLLNSIGLVIDASDESGSQSESIQRSLSAGVYYIRVFPFSGATNYNLRVSAAPTVSDSAGNTIGTARTINVSGTPVTFNDAVGFNDLNDYYRFTLGNSSNFQLDLTGLSSDADVQLLDSDGDVLKSSIRSGTQSENIQTSLSPGIYFIRVYPYSGDTEYSLRVSAQTNNATPPDNAGNSLGSARNINVSNTPRTFSDAVGSFDNNDYYRFNLANAGQIEINLTGLSSDADIQLLNASGNVITSSLRGGTSDENIVRQLSAGNYFIRVYPYAGNTNYDLTVSTNNSQPPQPPNNNPFSPITGFGFADASAAVGRALNRSNPFPQVPTFGGANDWNINMVNAPEVWNQGYTGDGVVVAVLDTGVDRNHTDLRNNIWTNSGETPNNGIDDDNNGFVDDVYGWNFESDRNNTLDVQGHGTHVAGTIAGTRNGTGVTGIAYNAEIMPVKVLGDDGSGSFQGIARGIYYAVDNGADVINMSLGGSSAPQFVKDAIDYASDRGVIVVMAAGNESQSQPAFPARFARDSGIAVGAVSDTNNIASFSNRAGNDSNVLYVTNPGVSIFSSIPNNRFDSFDGTSMATPHVAGIVALMVQANPNLTDAQVRNILSSTTNPNPTITSFIGAQSLRDSEDEKPFRYRDDGTIVIPPNSIVGGSGNDNLVGDGTDNTIIGFGGNDNLFGNAGDDILNGGAGNDNLNGGTGRDRMVGGAGSDNYNVDSAGDRIFEQANNGRDLVRSSINYSLLANLEDLIIIGNANRSGTGNSLNNRLTGNSGNNTLLGKVGNDTLTGNNGHDNLNGGLGRDSLIGGAGNDSYTVDNTGDRVRELLNRGRDLVRSSINYTLPSNVENLSLTGNANLSGVGNGLNNRIIGNNGNNTLLGNGGNDTLTGNNGNDNLNGGIGRDSMIGGAGNDSYNVDNLGDRVVEQLNRGRDLVRSSINYRLPSNVENLTLLGNANRNGVGNGLNNRITGNNGNNSLRGNGGNDTLTGNNGNDIINGGLGRDIMIGNAGNDSYTVDNIGDRIVEQLNRGRDLVLSSINYSLPGNVEDLSLTGNGNRSGTGNGLNNRIIGNSGNNSLLGNAGRDTLTGNSGNDVLNGGAGSDRIVGGVGSDTLIGGNGADVLTGGLGADSFRFNAPTERIDTITDFNPNADTILIRRGGFNAGLSLGTLRVNQFTTGASASGPNERFIYNRGTGALLFDRDGNGAIAAVRIATLDNGLALTNQDFVII